jgi:hypothetical protein
MIKTKGAKVFHPYDSIEEAISAGKMLNFTTALSLNVSDHTTWIQMLRNDEIPRFYIEGKTGMECVPEFN